MTAPSAALVERQENTQARPVAEAWLDKHPGIASGARMIREAEAVIQRQLGNWTGSDYQEMRAKVEAK